MKISCSWCGQLNEVAGETWPWCKYCGHRADVPRLSCTCYACTHPVQITEDDVEMVKKLLSRGRR